MLLAFTVCKACDFDIILEDLIGDSESEESDSSDNSSTEKPRPTTSSPSTTARPPTERTTLAPTSSTAAAPNNNTQGRSLEKPHRRVTRRRYLLHLQRKEDMDESISGEHDLRDLISDLPYPVRYAPHHARKVTYKPEDISDLVEHDDVEEDEVEEEGRSATVLVTSIEDEAVDDGRSMPRLQKRKLRLDGSVILDEDAVRKVILSSRLGDSNKPARKSSGQRRSTIRHVYVPSKYSSNKSKEDSPAVELFIINNYPNRVQNINQQVDRPENDTKQNDKRSTMIVREKGMGRPLLTDPSTFDEINMDTVAVDATDSNKPCISPEVNRIKEHTVRETIKINPVDHSEIHNVEENIRYSVIKSPCGSKISNQDEKIKPLSEALASMELPERVGVSNKNKMTEKDQSQSLISQSDLKIQRLPLVNSWVKNFNQEYAAVPNKHVPNKGYVSESVQGGMKESYPGMNHQNWHREDHMGQKPSSMGEKASGLSQTHEMEHMGGVIQEKNIYVDPHANMQVHHHEHQLYPTLEQYNVYNSVPSFPINNPSVIHHPSHQETVSEHEPMPDRVLEYQELPMGHTNSFREQHQENQSHMLQEHHEELPNHPQHQPINSTVAAPPKLINIL